MTTAGSRDGRGRDVSVEPIGLGERIDIGEWTVKVSYDRDIASSTAQGSITCGGVEVSKKLSKEEKGEAIRRWTGMGDD